MSEENRFSPKQKQVVGEEAEGERRRSTNTERERPSPDRSPSAWKDLPLPTRWSPAPPLPPAAFTHTKEVEVVKQELKKYVVLLSFSLSSTVCDYTLLKIALLTRIIFN